jgi:hypothetical protein
MLISNSFILSRYNTSYSSDILQYNITSDTIKKVSSLSSRSDYGLALKTNDNKYIYYFGGYPTLTQIHRFDTATKVTVKLNAALPSEVNRAAGVTTKHSVFIFNAFKNNILRFNLDSENVQIVDELSFGNGTVYSTACITDSTSNRVWLFPGSPNTRANRALIFNIISEITAPIPQNVSVPSLYYKPATVSTGRYGYFIGGFSYVAETGGRKHPTNGILRLINT